MEHPNRIERPAGDGGSSAVYVIAGMIVVLAVIGYFAWSNGYLGTPPAAGTVTAQTPTRQPVAPNALPNVTPNKPVDNTPATNTPQPQ